MTGILLILGKLVVIVKFMLSADCCSESLSDITDSVKVRAQY